MRTVWKRSAKTCKNSLDSHKKIRMLFHFSYFLCLAMLLLWLTVKISDEIKYIASTTLIGKTINKALAIISTPEFTGFLRFRSIADCAFTCLHLKEQQCTVTEIYSKMLSRKVPYSCRARLNAKQRKKKLHIFAGTIQLYAHLYVSLVLLVSTFLLDIWFHWAELYLNSTFSVKTLNLVL